MMRKFHRLIALTLMCLMAVSAFSASNAVAEEVENVTNPTLATRVAPEDEHYIFELSENVTRTHVYYANRYGIELAGDLYIAKDADMSLKYPALVIGPPFGGVKEQGPGVYANELAQRGFVVLTFDPSYHGYSGGQPRMVGSTDIYAEDFSAGVDYLGLQSFVDRDKIGAIGICGSGGFALSAAAQDSRIKAIATSVMYDISSMGNSMTGEVRAAQLEALSQQRWVDAESGTAAYQNSYPDAPVSEVPADMTGNAAEFYSFYATRRGWHPNALAGVTNTSMLSLMNFASLSHIGEISPRPILFVAGENAHSIMFSETAYAAANEPKELYSVPDAIHIDLYDQVDKIPFDKLESFFTEAFGE
ncbi:MAG: alpha/beta hydrolase [Clostridia bacterium]|nr:alpha/beta hydrolase [Clostridia bacterium]